MGRIGLAAGMGGLMELFVWDVVVAEVPWSVRLVVLRCLKVACLQVVLVCETCLKYPFENP